VNNAHSLTIPFVKMHGLGNDFVVIAAQDLPAGWQTPDALSRLALWACDRNTGVGGDGILIIHPTPDSPDGSVAQFIYYNNDGTVAEMCGNGMRCYARYLADHGLVSAKTFTLSTLAGPVTCTVSPDEEGNPHGTVAVDMGPPRFAPDQVPFNAPAASYKPGQTAAPLEVEGQTLLVWPVSMGNPHAVLFSALQPSPLQPITLGPLLEQHPAFPAKTNVEFVEPIDPTTLKVTVWERGCGWTQACGTGACGVVASAIRQGLVPASQPITVQLPGGDLSIQWSGVEGESVMMTGPATVAFEGSFSTRLLLTIGGNMSCQPPSEVMYA
jgi:diaminopimelate epimerase